MRASLIAMAAMVAGTYAQPTCPAAATTTVFVTVDSNNDPGPSIIVQTVTATVPPSAPSPWSPAQSGQPGLPATLTVTIDSYDPPPGGSQFTGPKPWESSSATAAPVTVVTATVYSPGSGDPNGGSPGSPVSPGHSVPGGQGTTTVTLPGSPGFPWNPSQSATTDCPFATDDPNGAGSNTAGVTVITTTLYRTNANPGQATPAVDSVVATFTVTFPQPAATGSVPGSAATDGAVNPASGELFTYTLTAPAATGPAATNAPSGPNNGNGGSVTDFTTTLYRTRPDSGQGTPVVDTLVTCFTVTFPSATGTGPVTGVPAASTPAPGSPDSPGNGGSVGITTRYVPTMVPGPDGSLSYSIQTVVSTFTVPTPGSPSTAGSGVTTVYVPANPAGAATTVVFPADPAGNPVGGPSTVVTTTLYASQPTIGNGNQPTDPSDPGNVVVFTLTVPQPPAGGGVNPTDTNGLPGGYTDPAQTGVPPFGGLPGPQITVTVASGAPDGGVPTTVAGVPTSVIGSYSVIVDPATAAAGSQNSPSVITLWPLSSTVDDSLPGAATSTLCTSSESTSTTVLTSSFINVVADETTTTPTLTPVPTPICTGTTEVGNQVLDFDDVSSGPLFNPYHRFWFSKGFLVGPPPLMPFLPSSGGRLVEFVPPILSNTSSDDVSGDTAQIGMGKLASSPCFQFDFFGMNLGCHSDSAVPNQLCVFTFTGYRWDATNATETEAVSQKAWVNACNQSSGCPLTPFSAVDFTDLSSILITLQVDGRPQVWWSDDIRVGWSKNDCATANCRQQFQPENIQLHAGPFFYWTSSGLRVLSSSRINRG
ncbi:hypothetical protein CSAL01_09233 [Colletotrichum salicis]|uniref:DUF7371 domain-containing protein n=1 Tax=Colletotrichum salicis TaxID=1209931 RepID=A0A135S3M6_9PEZI|nr:hypothetical protein CSAL01_09233 [Colletotrichum salicis]